MWNRRTHLVAALVCLPAGLAHAGEPIAEITPTVMLQAWGTVFDQDEDQQADSAGYGDPEHDPGFTIRRARLGMTGVSGKLDFAISVGSSAPFDGWSDPEPVVELVDALGGVTFDVGAGALRLSAGAQKVPVSRERLFSSKDLLFQERSVATEWMIPNREAGFVADWNGDYGARLRLGVFNGNGNLLGDDNTGVLTSARFELGTGETYKTWSPTREGAIGFGASAAYDQDVATNTLLLEADLIGRFGPITAVVEGVRSAISPTSDTTVAPPSVLSPTVLVGVTWQFSVFLPIKHGGLDLGARFGLFDDQTGVRNNGDVSIIHVGGTWRDVTPGLDVGLGLVHREELAGRKTPNDTGRLWAQIRFPAGKRGSALRTATIHRTDAYLGQWAGTGDFDGVVMQLDRTPTGELSGEVTYEADRYPIADVAVIERSDILALRVEGLPAAEAIWMELAEHEEDTWCGYAYEAGERDKVATGQGAGSWVCWEAR